MYRLPSTSVIVLPEASARKSGTGALARNGLLTPPARDRRERSSREREVLHGSLGGCAYIRACSGSAITPTILPVSQPGRTQDMGSWGTRKSSTSSATPTLTPPGYGRGATAQIPCSPPFAVLSIA